MVKKHELAGAGIRFTSALIDSFIVGLLVEVLWLPTVFFGSFGAMLLVLVFWVLPIIVIYYIILAKRWSATLGMKLVKIKLIDAKTHVNINYKIAFVRFVSMYVSSTIFGLGFIFLFFTKNKQNLHDLIANTLVVKTK
jgi:uncharacterized RDD family membrane protein YckC